MSETLEMPAMSARCIECGETDAHFDPALDFHIHTKCERSWFAKRDAAHLMYDALKLISDYAEDNDLASDLDFPLEEMNRALEAARPKEERNAE